MMLVNLWFALFVSLSSDCQDPTVGPRYVDCTFLDAAHELAHRACEIAVYESIAPNLEDDATDPRAEFVAELLCRLW